MNADQIIDELGGTGTLAAAFSVHKSTVSCWRRNGIPSVYWMPICRMASRRGKKRTINLKALAKQAQARVP